MSSAQVLGNLIATESTFKWEIPNFNTLNTDLGEALYSPTFQMTHRDEATNKIVNLHWRLQVYPNGGYMGDSNANLISVILENLDEIEISTQYSIALMEEDDRMFFQRESDGDIFAEKNSWGWSDFINKELVKCLVNGTSLLLSCRIFSTSVIFNNEESDEEDRSQALISHFKMLFDTEKFSDLTVKIGKQELHVHKNIVTSFSPVFLAMFENPMKEQNENHVDIVDIEYDVIKEMFRYMYVGKVNKIENFANDLVMAADKYCVNGLKRMCEKFLCNDFDMDNTLQRFELSVLYCMKKLKQKSIQCIVTNLKSFNAKQEFKELNSECKSELLSYIAEKLGDGNKQLMGA